MYGDRYIKKYQGEVAELFQQGVNNNASKLGPARMLGVLVANHARKYDLPTEYEI
ncbi:hypothetical protein PHMEG_00023371 [Phytophthora megakarya]|uniref:Uncharacterized protein n=1 Tax=Phytophthora megakarya TaxID=4795 RepID=A0A225VIV7_9STRA|nr:hypothetical protein PHMEG_00023371 [Phytophthora megakarya]